MFGNLDTSGKTLQFALIEHITLTGQNKIVSYLVKS